MSTRNLLNLVLLAIVGILVLIVVYEPGKQQDEPVPLTTVDTKTINKIHISRTGQKDVTLVKSPDTGKWQMLAPFKTAANRIKTESLLTLLSQHSGAQYAMADLDVKTYGLDLPRATIIFNDELKFEFGTTEPLNKQRYLRFNDTLHVIDDHFYYQLMSPVTVFVDHQLVPVEKAVTKLELPDLSLSLNEGTWQLTPQQDGVSNDQANELVENWKTAFAMHISEYKPAPASKQAKIYFLNEEKPLVFDIMFENDTLFLGRSDLGLKYQIAPDNKNELLKLPPKIETPNIDKP